MQQLNLPLYPLKTRDVDQKQEVFDIIRKKYILLNPEEWVRQQFIHYLIHEKNYPASLISIEKRIRVLGMQKRFDAVVAGQAGEPVALIEFKSPDVKIDQKTFEQIARYNMQLKVQFLIVSNGMKHYCCFVDYLNKTYSFLENIPEYTDLIMRD
jgi:hypothetical protein